MAYERSDAQAIIETVERLKEPTLFTDFQQGSVVIAGLPSGVTLQSLKPLLDTYLRYPERKKGSTRISSLDSFIEFVNRQKTEDTVVFVDDGYNPSNPDVKGQPRAVAVFNPHKATDRSAVPQGEGADHQDHTAVYAYPLSDEYRLWSSLDEAYDQAAFAAFIEEHIEHVTPPGEKARKFAASIGVPIAEPAELLQLSRNLTVNVKAKHAQAVNVGTGKLGLQFYEEQHLGPNGEPLEPAGVFSIGIPLLRHGDHVGLAVRLRFDVPRGGGQVTWSMTPQRLKEALEEAIAASVTAIADGTQLPVFRGAP